jgi:hypothetical protein
MTETVDLWRELGPGERRMWLREPEGDRVIKTVIATACTCAEPTRFRERGAQQGGEYKICASCRGWYRAG